MKFTAEHYFRASLERMAQARDLYCLGSAHALAMYSAGVAVECMLRAFKLRRDPTFDEKHDLMRLFHASGMIQIHPEALRPKTLSVEEFDRYKAEIHNAVNDVCLLWANDYRYASNDRLRSHLRRTIKLRLRVKGDLLKALSLRLLDAAQKFVEKGHVLWKAF